MARPSDRVVQWSSEPKPQLHQRTYYGVTKCSVRGFPAHAVWSWELLSFQTSVPVAVSGVVAPPPGTTWFEVTVPKVNWFAAPLSMTSWHAALVEVTNGESPLTVLMVALVALVLCAEIVTVCPPSPGTMAPPMAALKVTVPAVPAVVVPLPLPLVVKYAKAAPPDAEEESCGEAD